MKKKIPEKLEEFGLIQYNLGYIDYKNIETLKEWLDKDFQTIYDTLDLIIKNHNKLIDYLKSKGVIEMNKEKLINDCVGHIADDVLKKDVLTYKEQDEYKEYLSTIIETITKEKDKEIERLNDKWYKLKKELGTQLFFDFDTITYIDLMELIEIIESGDEE